MAYPTNHGILEHRRRSKVPRHLNRSSRRRNPFKTWPPLLINPQPLQRHHPRRTSERHSNPLVTKLRRASRQIISTPRPRTIRCGRSRGPIHGLSRTRRQNGRLGHPNVQGSKRLLDIHPSVFRRNLRYRPHSRRLGHLDDHLEGPLRQERRHPGASNTPLHEMGPRGQDGRARPLVPL